MAAAHTVLCVGGYHCRPLAIRVQLPTLERLDLGLRLLFPMLGTDLEVAANLTHLALLGGLTALALRAGPMHALLRHLQLPPGLKAGCHERHP